ncbi:E3 ubiquitin-protein ligase ATL4-like [Melia azedarach]|uniref:E3 ubiquitin-protein ligase ATL4-like n=1 Tax=Melia azedarach TaxID=155640 RepID=A0ACC1XBV7_MELAZ|nr:E3 ubiquitin-protein ligase ATL4-like [Melia azedarach]
MGLFEEDPSLITSHILYKTAVVIALLRWLLFCFFRFRNRTSPSPPPPPPPRSSISSDIIKEALVLVTFEDVRVRTPWVSDTCAVCLNHMDDNDLARELRNCCHVFHRECIDRWVDYDHQKTCPLCRAPLLTYSQSIGFNDWPKNEPNWAVERILYIFGDDLLM